MVCPPIWATLRWDIITAVINIQNTILGFHNTSTIKNKLTFFFQRSKWCNILPKTEQNLKIKVIKSPILFSSWQPYNRDEWEWAESRHFLHDIAGRSYFDKNRHLWGLIVNMLFDKHGKLKPLYNGQLETATQCLLFGGVHCIGVSYFLIIRPTVYVCSIQTIPDIYILTTTSEDLVNNRGKCLYITLLYGASVNRGIGLLP